MTCAITPAACAAAGLKGLTLHGLRRSFSSLTEWLEVPAGVVAQIQGHKPSATAEKRYKVRPLELLRVHHEKIEAWILEQAGVTFDAKAEAGQIARGGWLMAIWFNTNIQKYIYYDDETS